MHFIDRLSERLKRHPKRLVFPEGTAARIIQTARQFADLKLGIPILLGDRAAIQAQAVALDLSLQGIRLLDPKQSDERQLYVESLRGLPEFQDKTSEAIERHVVDPHTFGALMLSNGSANAFLSGATAATFDILKTLQPLIPFQDKVETVSSMQVLETKNCQIGTEGVLFLADCGILANPSVGQLADMAITVGVLSYHFTDEPARIALLSYSSKETHFDVIKVKEAAALAKERAKALKVPLKIEGALQVDVALDLQIARKKQLQGEVAGRANVLIFPDLSSGQIAARLVSLICDNVCAYGQILTGLKRPVALIPYGATTHDIFGTAVLVGSQAVDHRLLFFNF